MRVAAFLLGGALLVGGCKPSGSVDPSIHSAAVEGAWAVHETLEARIAAGDASEADRAAALDEVRKATDDGSAAHAYARASVAGRVAEGRGLQALALLEEMREWGEKSVERDPTFADMAAKRLLGTLYVLASRHLAKGDSEHGLELLEEVAAAHPDAPRNHLRVGEGYVALGDAESGFESLCRAVAGRADLSGEEQRLLDRLLDDVGGEATMGCE